MKPFAILLILSAILVAFQNCGESARNTGLLQQSQNALSSTSADNCPQGVCSEAGQFVWMSIREYEPYKIQISTLNAGHFNVGGQCGVGGFPHHSFIWELREGFGAQNIVGQGFSDDLCLSGLFNVPIIPNSVGTIQPDQRYTLNMRLVGVNENNEEVSNPQPSNQGSLDILFTTDAPK